MTTPMTAAEIEALRELERRATPGEWRFDRTADEQRSWIVAGDDLVADCDYFYEPLADANGAFIAAARNAVPRLLTTIDTQRALLQRVSNTSASIPGNRLFYALPEDVVKEIDAALKEPRHD